MVSLRPVIWWGVLVVVTTELLSASGLLTLTGVVVAWLGIFAAWVWVRAGQSITSRERSKTPPLSISESACLAAVLVILLVTLAVALIAPPTFGDAMSYHMARVAHWVQNRSVSFYPTNIDRQLWHNPWAEYVILHLQLVSGGDRLANLVQWAAFAGTIAVVARIAAVVGCARGPQYFAGLFAATLPMAIAQSTGAQNDLVAGFWLCVFILGVVEGTRSTERRSSASDAIMLGASLGLAVLTKGTNYVYAMPFALWWLLQQLRPASKTSISRIGLLALVALAINAPLYYRNIELYRWPLGPRDSDGSFNSTLGPRVMLSNLVRNTALHFGTPEDTRIPMSVEFNVAANKAVGAAHRLMRMDVNDPRTMWKDYDHFRVPFRSRHEGLAGNPFHVLLIFAAIAIVIVQRRKHAGLPNAYAICLAAQVVLFCFLVRWHPNHSRLHLPVFLAAAPLVAYAAAGLSRRWVTFALAALLFAQAVSPLVKNTARPLTGKGNVLKLSREQAYFVDQPQAKAPYTGAADFLAQSGCRDIGLKTGWAEWEYAFWAVAKPRLGSFRLTHVGVTNPSRSIEDKTPASGRKLCAIVTLNAREPDESVAAFPGFVTAWHLPGVSVRLREDSAGHAR